MRTDIDIDDLDGFLDEPIVAVLATLHADGTVLLSPVWHEWRDNGFNVWVGADDVKARHLRRDPHATIVVAESAPPLRGVELRGVATLLRREARETAVRIAERYIGSRGGGYVDSLGGEHVIIRLAPGVLRIWDFRDDHPEG